MTIPIERSVQIKSIHSQKLSANRAGTTILRLDCNGSLFDEQVGPNDFPGTWWEANVNAIFSGTQSFARDAGSEPSSVGPEELDRAAIEFDRKIAWLLHVSELQVQLKVSGIELVVRLADVNPCRCLGAGRNCFRIAGIERLDILKL
jgi:hypothetical protein